MTKFYDDGRVVVNSIEIPPPFVRVASEWYGGQGCMLYAVCSTGGLTTGTNCPVTDCTDDADREQKWYYGLWLELSSDAGYAARCAEKGHNGESDADDAAVLREFEDWVDNTVLPMIEAGYPALEDWGGN